MFTLIELKIIRAFLKEYAESCKGNTRLSEKEQINRAALITISQRVNDEIIQKGDYEYVEAV